MKKITWVFVVATLVSGCSTMTPARYSVSVDNNQALKEHQGAAVKVESITAAKDFNAICRLMGPIQAADGMTIPQFVEKALNDELKFAGVYSESGTTLTGTMTNISFSSVSGITNGTWDLALTLRSSNGESIDADISYGFKSGFDAVTACNQTAQALGAAVQDLIKQVVTDPQFGALIAQ